MNDLDEVLGQLPQANPDATQAHRVRALCHLELTRSRSLPRRSRDRRERVAKAGPLESALVGGFCAIYFTGVALMALHVHGLL